MQKSEENIQKDLERHFGEVFVRMPELDYRQSSGAMLCGGKWVKRNRRNAGSGYADSGKRE